MGNVDVSGKFAWGEVTHAFGPADDVPGWISGLRDPVTAAECLGELYGSIAHQGTRYSATAPCVPYLVEAARDRAVMDRGGVVFLVHFCAMGYSGDWLDWRSQRDLQVGPHERAAWDAVVAEHARLRGLLADSDRGLVGAALTVLAWTGDASTQVLTAIRAAVESADERDQGTGWLASVVLGQLPPGVDAPVDLIQQRGAGRFGAAAAAIRFAGAAAPPEAVDELCSIFASIEAGKALTACEFLMPEIPERIAASALSDVPAHLRAHTNAQLLTAIGRGFVLGTEPLGAYLRLNLGKPGRAGTAAAGLEEAQDVLRPLLGPLDSWGSAPTMDHRIYELEKYGLPGRRYQLAAWLRTNLP